MTNLGTLLAGMIVVCLAFSAGGAPLDDDALAGLHALAAPSDVSPDRIFHDYAVIDAKKMVLSSHVDPDGFCGGYTYYISLMYAGKYQSEDYSVELLLETQTQEQLDKIVLALKENYQTKGLPNCLKDDKFIEPIVSYQLKILSFQPVNQPAGTCAGADFLKPLTSCINVDKIYP